MRDMTNLTDTRSDALRPVHPDNHQAARTWSAGGAAYERISVQIQDAIEHCVDRLGAAPGGRVLDVATGTGFAARRLLQRGYRVTGVDFGPDVLAAARELDRSNAIDFQLADAEQLPFEDGAFDAVISTFGVMFCKNPERAASELARVCKPGGRIALATWAETGGIRDMFQVIVNFLPGKQAPQPSPFRWGSTEHLQELFSQHAELGFEEGVSQFRARDGQDAYDQFAGGYGPVRTLLTKLDDAARAQFEKDFVAFHDEYTTPLGMLMPRPYLITAGTRR